MQRGDLDHLLAFSGRRAGAQSHAGGVFNGTFQMLNAALAGFGLSYVPEDVAQPQIAKGRLKRVLEDWCPPYSGYHLYYPSRRQSTRLPDWPLMNRLCTSGLPRPTF